MHIKHNLFPNIYFIIAVDRGRKKINELKFM